jgi:hypothetical protein
LEVKKEEQKEGHKSIIPSLAQMPPKYPRKRKEEKGGMIPRW